MAKNCALSDVLLPLFGLSSVVPTAYMSFKVNDKYVRDIHYLHPSMCTAVDFAMPQVMCINSFLLMV